MHITFTSETPSDLGYSIASTVVISPLAGEITEEDPRIERVLECVSRAQLPILESSQLFIEKESVYYISAVEGLLISVHQLIKKINLDPPIR